MEKVFGVEEAEKIIARERPKVTAKDCFLEARIAGVDPVTYAKKINAQNEKEVTETDKRIFNEAKLMCGFSESIPEAVQKIKKEIQESKPTKTEAELLCEKFQSGGMKNVTLESVQKLLKAEQDKQSKINFLVAEKRLSGGTTIKK